eukprot:3284129-Prymnesium_polylepis.1
MRGRERTAMRRSSSNSDDVPARTDRQRPSESRPARERTEEGRQGRAGFGSAQVCGTGRPQRRLVLEPHRVVAERAVPPRERLDCRRRAAGRHRLLRRGAARRMSRARVSTGRETVPAARGTRTRLHACDTRAIPVRGRRAHAARLQHPKLLVARRARVQVRPSQRPLRRQHEVGRLRRAQPGQRRRVRDEDAAVHAQGGGLVVDDVEAERERHRVHPLARAERHAQLERERLDAAVTVVVLRPGAQRARAQPRAERRVHLGARAPAELRLDQRLLPEAHRRLLPPHDVPRPEASRDVGDDVGHDDDDDPIEERAAGRARQPVGVVPDVERLRVERHHGEETREQEGRSWVRVWRVQRGQLMADGRCCGRWPMLSPKA